MSVSIEDVLMAPGSWSLDCDWDTGIAAALAVLPGPHVQIWRGEELFYAGVVLAATISKVGIWISGFGLLWWLGVGTDGPVIEDREYLAGTNKLSNPGFELGNLYWTHDDTSLWDIDGAGLLRTGSFSAHMSAVAGEDGDAIRSADSFETQSGQTFQASTWVRRVDGGSVGGARLRVIFDGQFGTPNLVSNGDFSAGDADWTYTTNVGGSSFLGEDSGSLKVGPVEMLRMINNSGFDFDFSGWGRFPTVAPGDWYRDLVTVFAGTASAATGGGGPANKFMFLSSNLPVSAGETYRFTGHIFAGTGTDGTGMFDVQVIGPGVPTIQNQSFPFSDLTLNGAWAEWMTEIDIPDGYNAMNVLLRVDSHTTGFWSFDTIHITRIRGNTVTAESDPFSVVPGLGYEASATVWTDGAAIPAGEIELRLRFTATGRPDVVIVGASSGATEGERRKVQTTFTPPSGYGTARIQVVGRDVLGQPFWVDDVNVHQEDKNVSVVDATLDLTSGAWHSISEFALVPVGSDHVQVEVIADQGVQLAVDDVSLSRFGSVMAAEDIVAELLLHPDTSDPLLTAGTITGTDSPLYDWRIRSMTDLAAIQHFSRSGVVLPVREYRVRSNATFHWAEDTDLFVDRVNVVFGPGDLEVLDDPEVTISGEGRVTKVRVIGADRRRPNGDHFQITGEATNPAGGAVDYFGNDLARTRVVQDSSLEHPTYASSYARYVADSAQPAPEAMRLGLSDWSALGEFDVGDWVYPWKPDAGLEDAANERSWKGQPAYPVKRRVISRTVRPSQAGWRAELRFADGSTLPLAVRWNTEMSAEIEVGDPRPEFVADPQGGLMGEQLTRYRASGGR